MLQRYTLSAKQQNFFKGKMQFLSVKTQKKLKFAYIYTFLNKKRTRDSIFFVIFAQDIPNIPKIPKSLKSIIKILIHSRK